MHLAQIDKNNIVLTVIVADSEFRYDSKKYVKTYKNVEGKNYAGIGHIYHPDKDNFSGQQPFPSWTLDDQCLWQPPVIRPEGSYDWNENTDYVNGGKKFLKALYYKGLKADGTPDIAAVVGFLQAR